MLAARWHGRGDVRVEEVADPGAPPRGWVRLRIDACGICGTDVEEYRQGPILIPRQPHPLTGRNAPLTLGHEPAGTVEVAGEDVALAPGTPVAVEGNLSCGDCWWCRRGETHLCVHIAPLGLRGDGALAEVMLAPASMCVPLGEGVPAAHGALAEPLSVAVRAIRRAGVAPGCSVGIVGGGTVGLLALQVARRAGAETVLVVDRVPERRRLAERLGATVAVAPEEAGQAALDLSDGIGLDTTLEVAGNVRAAAAAIALSRRGGRTVLLGVYDDFVKISMLDMLLGEREVVASLSHTVADDFAEAVRLVGSGEIEVAPLITDRVVLSRVVEDGLERLVAEPTAHLKVIVVP